MRRTGQFSGGVAGSSGAATSVSVVGGAAGPDVVTIVVEAGSTEVPVADPSARVVSEPPGVVVVAPGSVPGVVVVVLSGGQTTGVVESGAVVVVVVVVVDEESVTGSQTIVVVVDAAFAPCCPW